MKRLLFAGLMVAATAACSSGGSGKSSDGIPEKLNFSAKTGERLSEQDWSDLESGMDQGPKAPSSYIVWTTGSGISYDQEQKLSQEPEEFRNAINNLNVKCSVTQPTTQTIGALNPDEGQNQMSVTINSSISGSGCPDSFSSNTAVNTSVLSYNKDAKEIQIQIDMKSTTSESVNDLSLQSSANMLSQNAGIDGNIKMHVADQSMKMYGKLNINSSLIDARNKTLHTAGYVEFLVTGSSSQSATGQIVVQIEIDGLPKTINISAYSDNIVSNSATFKVYVNGQTPSHDVVAKLIKTINMGNFGQSVTVNSDGTITMSGLKFNNP